MFGPERQEKILRDLSRRRRCSVDALQRVLGVSRSTLQRDLRELEQRGEVVRVHGGVMHPQFLAGESTLERRCKQHVRAKQRIAAAAADLVPPNAAVFLDAGSTCLAAARCLLPREDIKIFSHSVPLLHAALGFGGPATVVALGGELRPASGALVGGLAERWMGRLRFDVALIGASGLDASTGASTTELHEAGVKEAALDGAERAVLLCDASKCDRPAPVSFAAWGRFETWVVDRSPGEPFGSVGCALCVAE